MARFTTYFEKRGKHEIVSLLQSVGGVLAVFLVAPENQGVIARLTGGEFTKEVFWSFVIGFAITAGKTSTYMVAGKDSLIRTPDKQ